MNPDKIRLLGLRLFGALLALLLQGCAAGIAARAAAPAYAVVDRTTIGGSGGWDFITFEPARGRLFISRGDHVLVWDAASRRIVGDIEATAGVHGVALAPELKRGFASNGRANTVSVFDLDTLAVVKTIAVSGVNPDAILYEPRYQRIYAFNGRSGNASVIDARSLAEIATIPLGGKPEVAVGDGAGRVFVNIEDTAQLAVIDEATHTVTSRWSLAPCTGPTGLAIDVAHERLFAVCADRRMVVVDGRSGRIVATMPIGAGPDGAEFDPVLGIAFSSNGGSGTLSLVHEDDAEHFTAMPEVATEKRARTLALDPATHRVYLVTAQFGPVPPPTAEQPRPRAPMVPGTFAVLVAAPR